MPANIMMGGITVDPLEGQVYDDWSFVLMYNNTDLSSDPESVEGSGTGISIFATPSGAEHHLQIKKDDVTIKVLIITPNYN